MQTQALCHVPTRPLHSGTVALLLTLLTVSVCSCEGTVVIAGAPCDLAHPCPGAFACVEGACIPTGRIACDKGQPCAVGVCDEAAGFCVTCISKEQCPVGVCHPTAHICVGCMEDQDCTGGVCLPQSRTCVGCRTHSDCPTHLCNIPSHVCLGCKGDQQCGSGQCDEASGVCAKFSTDSPEPVQGVDE